MQSLKIQQDATRAISSFIKVIIYAFISAIMQYSLYYQVFLIIIHIFVLCCK